MSYTPEYFTARESWRDWRIEAQWLIEHARADPGSLVLEIGCGGGGLMRMLRLRGVRAVGVDTLNVALNLAHDRLDAETGRQGDKEQITLSPNRQVSLSFLQIGETNTLPFRTESFDAIIAQHALEHLPDVDAALFEWKRLLKPNGRLALATPNVGYPDPAHFADDDHAHVFAPDELCDVVQRTGLSVEMCQTIFPYLSRARALRGIGVIGYKFFQPLPYFSKHGRTILLAAKKI